jgi:hypothetical protein
MKDLKLLWRMPAMMPYPQGSMNYCTSFTHSNGPQGACSFRSAKPGVAPYRHIRRAESP